MMDHPARMRLMVTTLHHLCRHFCERAVLKGGMQLALYSSSRSTNDLDFVFVPYASKKEILVEVRDCLQSMGEGTVIRERVHSKNVTYEVTKNDITIQVEISVASEMPSTPINTATLAQPLGLAPQMIRVMKPEIALAHKIAAWNERRLLRDLYDIYFWFSVQRVKPDPWTLLTRLSRMESQIPSLKPKKSITVNELCAQLDQFCAGLTEQRIDDELSSLGVNERRGLLASMVAQMKLLQQELRGMQS